ncbi:15096_t:CDS:10 [Gigaspora margarita]|uniref:Vacuolar protein sorting-associated protein 41 n=1 Tax=Gigaspora margarita TaxID=4874 RepID=A0ABN7UVJ2_GIGMA|nr:15096_t:CDS:10 [Gigaspora margarita]
MDTEESIREEALGSEEEIGSGDATEEGEDDSVEESSEEDSSEDAASTMAVSDRFVALGTHNGDVFILDFDGNLIKRFSSHTASVNDISIDTAEEFVASASMDGKVVIHGMYVDSTQVFNYRRPLKCVALDPDFSKKDTQQFVSGGLAGQLILNEKGWFGQKQDKVLQHSGEGPIYAARWRGTLIAYANDEGVKMYDTQSQQRITYIRRPQNNPRPDLYRPDLYRCNLCWRNDKQLLIGWANYIQIATVKEQNISGHPPLFAEVNMILNTNDFVVCGAAPFGDMTLILAYLTNHVEKNEDSDDPEQHKRPTAKRPELRIMNSSNEEISIDALPLHGFMHYQANDYVLDYFPSEDMFYIVSPKDLVLARPRDSDDHVGWLLDRYRYEEALDSLQEAQAWGGSKVYDINEVGERYLTYLIRQEDYSKAAENCKKVLKTDKELWEKWIFTFSELKHLKEITPYIPFKDPQLSSTIYEIVLAYFLNNDHKSLYETITNWPSSIYNVQSVIEPIEDVLEKENENKTLMECLAELYAYNQEPEKALEYNLRLRRPNAFDLIRKYNLFSAVQDKVILLMDFDQHFMSETQKANEKKKVEAKNMPAVQLLIENTDSVPIGHVVNQLQSRRYFLHIYLDALFSRDHHIGFEFHDLQVELYAEYDYPRLLDFLRASNYYSLEKAYEICKQRDLVPEMVFILGRMGNNKQALMLIIERLGDVQRAIDFAKEQADDDLWEDLLKYSLDKPRFITGLLDNLGNIDIDPKQLIKRIPDGLKIDGLKQALIKVLQDFNLQASLREGCQKILVSDSVSMANQLHRAQKRGISCRDDMVCNKCSAHIIKDVNVSDAPTTHLIFFCGHAFHEKCLFESDAIPKLPENFNKPHSVGTKVRHATLLQSMIPRPRCPICNESNQVAKQKEKPVRIRGFVRSTRDDEGMPPMVPLRL